GGRGPSSGRPESGRSWAVSGETLGGAGHRPTPRARRQPLDLLALRSLASLARAARRLAFLAAARRLAFLAAASRASAELSPASSSALRAGGVGTGGSTTAARSLSAPATAAAWATSRGVAAGASFPEEPSITAAQMTTGAAP